MDKVKMFIENSETRTRNSHHAKLCVNIVRDRATSRFRSYCSYSPARS